MVKYIFTIFIVATFLTTLSCSKASGPADGNSVQPNNHRDTLVSITANVNGKTWQTDSVFGYYVKNSGNDSSKMNLEIVGTQVTGNSSMTIILANFAGLGNYPINPPINSLTYYVGNTRYYATSGSVIITNDTGAALTGTFTFQADTIIVTSGAFNVANP